MGKWTIQQISHPTEGVQIDNFIFFVCTTCILICIVLVAVYMLTK
jgi:hypothetical protein